MSKSARKFSQEVTGRKSSLQNDWPILHKGVRGRYLFVQRESFSSVVFSNFNFRLEGTLQELQLDNDLADFSQIWPDARKIYYRLF